jgi:hypothetical protein
MFWMRSLHPPVSASMNRDHRKGQVCHDPVSYKMISTFYHCTHDISPTLTWELALHRVLTWCLRPDFYGSVYNWVESIVPVTYPFLLNPKSSHTLSCCSLLYSVCFLYFCSSFLIPTRCYHVIIIERFFCYYEFICALTVDFWCTMKILNPFNYRLHNRVSTGFGLEMCSAVGLGFSNKLEEWSCSFW